MKRVGELLRESLVDKLKGGFENNSSVFCMTYSKLTGVELNEFRKNLKSAGAEVFVSKNRLAKLALKELKHDELADRISGQIAFVWSNSDSSMISKVLVDFSKNLDAVEVEGGVLEGRILAKADVKVLSDLPSREVLLSTLLGTIQAPLTRLMGAMNAKSRDLLSVLKQYSEQKGGNE